MRKLTITLGVLLLVGAAVVLWRSSDRDAWTTDSETALAAYERGRQAQMKFYNEDAAKAFAEALDHDPEFVVAKIAALDAGHISSSRRRQLLEELRATNRGRLTDRERFLLDLTLANVDDDQSRWWEIVESYVEHHPKDPWAVMVLASAHWRLQDWDKAEKLYKRLLEIDPNWVLARNHLGYIAMATGRFEEAEEQFKTYRYSAPDQANPHDSLGELYVLLGRYDEARAELEEAVRIRPDFCASYQNLFRLATLERDVSAFEPILVRVEEHCNRYLAQGLRCGQKMAVAFFAADFGAPWRDPEFAECEQMLEQPDIIQHLMALRAGRLEAALAMEEGLRQQVAKIENAERPDAKNVRALLLYLEGQRLVEQGDYAAAIPKLREVEADSTWWASGGGGLLKLVARLVLAETLEALGDDEGAREALDRLRAVNPRFLEWLDGSPFTSEPVTPRAVAASEAG